MDFLNAQISSIIPRHKSDVRYESGHMKVTKLINTSNLFKCFYVFLIIYTLVCIYITRTLTKLNILKIISIVFLSIGDQILALNNNDISEVHFEDALRMFSQLRPGPVRFVLKGKLPHAPNQVNYPLYSFSQSHTGSIYCVVRKTIQI